MSFVCFDEGKKVIVYILNSGYEFDIGVGNVFISVYFKSGSMIDVCEVFDKMFS